MDSHRMLAARYAADFPAETALRLDPLSSAEVAVFLESLRPEVAGGVVTKMSPSRVAAALENVEEGQLAEVLGCLAPARCALILRSVARVEQARMVELLEDTLAMTVARLLQFPDGSAGAVADPVQGVLSPAMSVDDSARLVFDPGIPYVYCVDDAHRLVGVVHRRILLAAAGHVRIGELMSPEVVRLPAAAPLTAFRKHPAWRQLDALPVVDRDGVLVGVIREKSMRRLGIGASTVAGRRPPAVAAFLEFGELYWTGLASLVAVMAGGTAVVAPGGVDRE